MSRLRLRPGSCRDIVHVKAVPACPGEEVQAAATADYPGALGERLAIREHDPVFAGRPGAAGAKSGQGEPVTIRAVAAEQRDTRARHRQGTGARMSLCQPVTAPDGTLYLRAAHADQKE